MCVCVRQSRSRKLGCRTGSVLKRFPRLVHRPWASYPPLHHAAHSAVHTFTCACCSLPATTPAASACHLPPASPRPALFCLALPYPTSLPLPLPSPPGALATRVPQLLPASASLPQSLPLPTPHPSSCALRLTRPHRLSPHSRRHLPPASQPEKASGSGDGKHSLRCPLSLVGSNC